MPGTVYTHVDSVAYSAGWTRTPLEDGKGYVLTSTGGVNADATITRDDPYADVVLSDAPVGTTITVNGGGTADVNQP